MASASQDLSPPPAPPSSHRDPEEQASSSTINTTSPSRPSQKDSQLPTWTAHLLPLPDEDANKVSWKDAQDPESPKNWSRSRKWMATFVVASFTFISPLSSSIPAPALGIISSELGITSDVERASVLSIFVAANAVGPLFFGPLSEVFGRVPVLQASNLIYLAFNLACGFSRTPAQILVCRFLSGIGGSGPLAVGGGVLSDCWLPEQRGQALSIYSLAPVLGPALGPIAGGFIAENTTWRWIFWATTIAGAVILAIGTLALPETYAPVLLARKAKRLRKATGNQRLYADLATEPLARKLATSFQRPFVMLFTQPVVITLALYMAYIYGLIYIVLSTFPMLLTDPHYYHLPLGTSSLNFIAVGLGFTLGAQLVAPLNDRIYHNLKERNGGQGRPEFRCVVMVPAALFVPIGLFWYGWSAQARLHWIMPDIGAAIWAIGIMIAFQSIQTYIVDSYARFAASALAAINILRSIGGFGFPLVAPALYQSLGYGWGNSILAFISLGLGIPAPILLWKFGSALRGRGQFAAAKE